MSSTIFRKFLVIIDLILFSAPIVFSFLIGTPGTQMLDIFPIIPEAIFFSLCSCVIWINWIIYIGLSISTPTLLSFPLCY